MLAKVLIPERALDEKEQEQDVQETLDTRVGKAQGGCALLSDRYWVLQVLERGFTDEAMMADALDVEQTSVGCKADLAQFGKVYDASANTKITRVVDGRFGPESLPLLVVLLDTRLLVIDMQRGDDALGNDTGTESTRRAAVDLAIEDQADLARATDVQVLADHLLEEDAPRHRVIQNLRE